MPVIRRDDFLKPRDSWLDVLVLDHLSVPLTRLCARMGLTPTSVSVISIGWRLLAIAAFADDRLPLGAVAYIVGLLLDGVDGKLARLTKRTSTLGAALDYSADMGLFAALTLSLGVAVGSSLWLIGGCFAVGVASALAPSPVVEDASVIGADSGGWNRRTASHRLRSLPGVLEVHFVMFGLSPLLGGDVVTATLAVAALYFLATWIGKLAITAKVAA